MKKTSIVFLSLVILFFTGCSKNDSDPPFQSYLRFKLDGVQTECTQHIRATYLPPSIGPDNVITISGDWTGGSISLYLNENNPLSAGQYLFEPFKWRTGEIWTNLPGTTTYHAGGSCLACSSVEGSGRITFLELSPGYVRGNFEFVTGLNAGNTFKAATNGEFYIKRN